MSLMFNKLNTIYNYFSQLGYNEKYTKLRNIIIENKNNDNIFMDDKDIGIKYTKVHSKNKKKKYYSKIPNDIENNIDSITKIHCQHECDEDNDSVCSHVIVQHSDYPIIQSVSKSSSFQDFCHVNACDIV